MRFPLALALALTGCMVGPDYRKPDAVGLTAAFKEAPPGWTVAQPEDIAAKGEWWTIYNDPLLDRLERQVAISNQNVAEFAAQYREAQATVDIARSSLFPTLGASAGVIRSSRGGGAGVSGTRRAQRKQRKYRDRKRPAQWHDEHCRGRQGQHNTTYTLERTASWDSTYGAASAARWKATSRRRR